MKHEEINAKVRTAFDHAVPDVLDSVISDIASGNFQKNQILGMGGQKNMKAIARRITGIAAAAVILIGGAAGFAVYNNNYKVASTISLDVNPSVEIRVNRKEDVLSVTALNEDGKIIIDNMDFEGSSIDVTVNALIGSMLRNGYLTDLANSILISVDDDDAVRGAELQKKLADEVNALLQTNTFSGAVLSQTVTADSELEKLASDHGITTGKAQFVNTIVASNPVHTFEELADLSINDLNLLSSTAASAGTTASAVESVGQASDKAYIGGERAKEIAFEHAGVLETDVYALEVEMDYERGVMVYEVDFDAAGYEYDYDINALTGEIVKSDRETDDDYGKKTQKTTTTDNTQKTTESANAAVTASASTEYITPEQAKEIALTHAGVAADTVYDYKCEFDYDDGRAEYEIDFESGEYDYDYDIDAVTGEIIKSNKEYDDENLIENTSDRMPATADTVIRAEDIAAVQESIQAGDLDRIVEILAGYDVSLSAETVQNILSDRKANGKAQISANDVTASAKGLDAEKAGIVAALINGADNGLFEKAGYITPEEAKAIALSDAGVHENNIFDYDCEFDNENGRAVYEIDFDSMNYEHDYDIDAVTGEIIKSDKEPLD